jgi:primosomal replication protein N
MCMPVVSIARPPCRVMVSCTRYSGFPVTSIILNWICPCIEKGIAVQQWTSMPAFLRSLHGHTHSQLSSALGQRCRHLFQGCCAESHTLLVGQCSWKEVQTITHTPSPSCSHLLFRFSLAGLVSTLWPMRSKRSNGNGRGRGAKRCRKSEDCKAHLLIGVRSLHRCIPSPYSDRDTLGCQASFSASHKPECSNLTISTSHLNFFIFA